MIHKIAQGKHAELRAMNSSLAILIDEDDKFGFAFYVYDRKTRCIISKYDVIINWIQKLDDLSPIKKRRIKK